jgi:DNA-binding NtrC family response regulator
VRVIKVIPDREYRSTKAVSVLLVDDEAPFVSTVAKRLSRMGIRVTTALDGEEALRVLAERPDIDVIVLDIRMPVMDGLQTLAELRRLCSSIPVIILTGHGTVESAIRGMKLGAFDYLTKPCELETLVKRIEQACSRRRSGP